MTADISPQLNNFIILLAAFLLFVWVVRVLYRSRALYDLQTALGQRTIVRLDGLGSSIREVGPISRQHLQQILTARSRYTTSVLAPVSLPVCANSKSFKITNTVDPATKQSFLTLHFKMTCSVSVVAEVYYGLKFSAIQGLFSSRYEQKRKDKKLSKKSRTDSVPGSVGDSDSIELHSLKSIERPPQSMSFQTDQFAYKVVTPAIPPCRDQDVEIALNTKWLIAAVSQSRRCYPLSLVLRDVEHIADDSQSAKLKNLDDEKMSDSGLRRRSSKATSTSNAQAVCQLTMLLFTGESASKPAGSASAPSGPSQLEVLPQLNPVPPSVPPPGRSRPPTVSAEQSQPQQAPESIDLQQQQEQQEDDENALPSAEPHATPRFKQSKHQLEATSQMYDIASSESPVPEPSPMSSGVDAEDEETLAGLRSLNSAPTERKVQERSPKSGPTVEPSPPVFVPTVKVDSQLLLTDTALLELQEVFGLDDPNNMECSVCLAEPKDIIPLPCRHCCVCHVCFENIRGKCPVCRSQILSFMKFSGTDKNGTAYMPPSLQAEAGRGRAASNRQQGRNNIV